MHWLDHIPLCVCVCVGGLRFALFFALFWSLILPKGPLGPSEGPMWAQILSGPIARIQKPFKALCCHFPLWAPGTSKEPKHCSDVIMGMMASQITRTWIVYSSVCSGSDHRKHQSSVSLVFVKGIHRWPVYSPHKRPVTQKIFPFDDIIMRSPNFVWGISWRWLGRFSWFESHTKAFWSQMHTALVIFL